LWQLRRHLDLNERVYREASEAECTEAGSRQDNAGGEGTLFAEPLGGKRGLWSTSLYAVGDGYNTYADRENKTCGDALQQTLG
jgi:hypothetical protein